MSSPDTSDTSDIRQAVRATTSPVTTPPVETAPAQPASESGRGSADPWLVLAGIVVLGGISAAAYHLGFVRPYLMERYYLTPLLDLAKINHYTASAANEWGFTWIVLFACYYLSFRIMPSAEGVSRAFRRGALALICGWAALFSIDLIFMYPVGAADLFDQIFRARLTARYGLNPFTTLPASIQGDPFQQYVAWRGDPSPYGPMWEVLAAGAGWLAGNSLWNNLIIFKLLVAAAYGVSVALTYGILRTLRPDWALKGTLFFAWNPLVLFEVAGNGHNDAVVVMFLLAAVYLLVLAKQRAVLPALMAGVLTKFVPFVLVPPAVSSIWRDRACGRRSSFEAFSSLLVGGVLALGLAVVLYAPFWEGPQSIGALGRQGLFTASIPRVIVDALMDESGMSQATAQAIVRNAAAILVGLVSFWLALRIYLRGNARTVSERQTLVSDTLSAFYEIIFVYLALATLWFQPWYLMWLVALTAPTARLTNVNRTVLFCIGGIANYFVWDFIWLWNRASVRDIQITSVLAVYTLPLLYTLYVWLLHMRDRQSRLRAEG